MKTALVTTTINVPTVLSLYREIGPDVYIFVAGDKKSPHVEISAHSTSLNYHYFKPTDQSEWACSELLGWNTIARRNIAVLEALQWGAETIVTIDDDNIPLDPRYFENFNQLFEPFLFSGPCVSGYADWFDPGQLLLPPHRQRGFPVRQPGLWQVGSAVRKSIGIASGVVLGDTDTDAVTRLGRPAPVDVHGASELLRNGFVVHNKTWTIFNTQNTAYLRELAPAMLLVPQFGRYDDIFASLVTQRVMRDRGLHVHHGQPFVWQQRNPHKLLNDLRAETFGMEHVEEFAGVLNATQLLGKSVIDDVRRLYEVLRQSMPLSAFPTVDALQPLVAAWLRDCEKVL